MSRKLENATRLIRCRSFDGFGEGADLRDEMIDLGAGGAGVGLAFREAGFEFGRGHAEAAIGGETGDEVIAIAFPGAVGAGGGDGVLLDHFVGGLAADPVDREQAGAHFGGVTGQQLLQRSIELID